MIKRQEIYKKLKLFEENTFLLILVIVSITAFVAFFVYQSGGTRFSYTYLIYLPIVLAAYFYKIKGGLLISIIGGLFLGPLMPINTDTMVMQSFENWFFRMFLLIIIGVFSGSLFSLLESQLEKVNQIAYYEPETKLPNKTKLKDDLEKKIKKGTDFHIFILSINNFIDIYKLIGFINFSNYINKLLEYIKSFKGIKDRIYYINENKYGIIIEKRNLDNLLDFLKDFVDYLDQAVKFNQISIFNDITLGVSSCPNQSQIAGELIDQAFIALEKADEKKLHYWIYEDADIDIENSGNNIELLGQVKKSILEGHFELDYQPKINLSNNQIETFEALIRWKHPQRGLISPAEFIPIVEQSNLIEPLTDWIVKKALSDINQFNQNNDAENYSIAVNISTRNLQHPNFTESLINYLDRYSVEPKRLSLEITETELMMEIEENIKKLQRLKDKGIKIYLDDFGKGYSSLKYLKELPVDFIKIDRYFIKYIGEDTSAENIIHSIINMSQALDLEVVAEGVETKAQLDFLKDLKCDYAQGYYFSRPDSKENIIDWLDNNNSYFLN